MNTITNIGSIIRLDPDNKGWLHGRPSTVLTLISAHVQDITNKKLMLSLNGKEWHEVPISTLDFQGWSKITKVSQGAIITMGIDEMNTSPTSSDFQKEIAERCRRALQGDYTELDVLSQKSA